MNPHRYAHFFDKTYYGEKTASSAKMAGKSGYLPAENCNWIHAYHPVLVSTQSGLRTLISYLETIGIGKDFLSRIPATQQLREIWTNGAT
jgi:hypothetical protein